MVHTVNVNNGNDGDDDEDDSEPTDLVLAQPGEVHKSIQQRVLQVWSQGPHGQKLYSAGQQQQEW